MPLVSFWAHKGALESAVASSNLLVRTLPSTIAAPAVTIYDSTRSGHGKLERAYIQNLLPTITTQNTYPSLRSHTGHTLPEQALTIRFLQSCAERSGEVGAGRGAERRGAERRGAVRKNGLGREQEGGAEQNGSERTGEGTGGKEWWGDAERSGTGRKRALSSRKDARPLRA